MANFKKEDKASMLARLDVLEEKVKVLEREMAKPMETTIVETVPAVTPSGISVGYTLAQGAGAWPTASITTSAPLTEVKHKCQTNTCESMATKEYQGKDRKMWLCDSHKF